jgi:anti-sigma factor RsiW
MSCSPFDLNDYFLKELPETERREVESHVRECRQCCEELERLRLTEASLFALREEEIPQRIAFVSDKVFEPAPWRRWWGAFWGSAARLAFASSAMLLVAILVFALTRGPVQTRVVTAYVAPPDVQAQIQTAVDKAVRDKTERMMADFLKQTASDEASINLLDHRLEAKAVDRYRQSSAGGPQ